MIGAILGVGSALLGVGGAIADHKAQKKNAKAERAAARTTLTSQLRDLSLRGQQEMLAAAQEANLIKREGLRTRGSLAANAAASNVAGASVDALEAELLRNESEAMHVLDTNLSMTLDQITGHKRAAITEANNRIAGAPNPSALATGIRAGGSALSAGYEWMRLRP